MVELDLIPGRSGAVDLRQAPHRRKFGLEAGQFDWQCVRLEMLRIFKGHGPWRLHPN
jgi:hypothetical protein